MMTTLLVANVILLHLAFLVLESFLWDKPIGLRIFGHSRETARKTKVLAQNQGLYNAFLAAGLAWGLSLGDEGQAIVVFFLSFVVLAGIVGGATANRTILYVQALPALVALGYVLTG